MNARGYYITLLRFKAHCSTSASNRADLFFQQRDKTSYTESNSDIMLWFYVDLTHTYNLIIKLKVL